MKRVLVADDDDDIAELMRVVLEDAGYLVVTATDAHDLPSGPVDCVITDLMSVSVYSREDARDWILHLQGRYPNVPIIVATAHLEAARDGDALGVRGVIAKPFDIDHLPIAVRAAMAP